MSAILVEVSARHVHVTQEALEILFGAGARLHEKKKLSQPTEFACEERVTIIGPKKELKNVSILGPCRAAVQVELSITDARNLGIIPVVRCSGDISGTPGCKLVGPAGELEIQEGVIVAKRHVHVTPGFAKKLNISENDLISVSIADTGREVIFGDVVVRISDKFKEAMHIDTDEANAAGMSASMSGEILD